MVGRSGGRPGMMAEGSSRPSLRAAVVSLKSRDFRLLFASMLASNMAMGMQMLARGWLAFDLTGSFAIMGVISFSFAIPMFLFSLIGGATADRVEKRTLLVLTQFGTLITALATGIMITTGVISVPLLFAVGIVQGTVMAFRMPVQMAMLAEVVPEDDLMSAMAINNAAMSGTRLLAPLTAGLLLATSGVDMVYYAQVLMYVVTLVFVLQLPRTTGHLVGADERGTVMFEAIGGLRYVWGDKQILMLLIMGSIPMMLMMPPMMTMLPGFAVTELGLGGDGLSYLMTLSGIGTLVGSFAVATLTEFKRKPLLQMISGLGAGLGLVALGLGTKAFGLPGALAALLVVGLFQGPFMTLNMTMVMSKAKPEYLGRVMSVFMLLFGLMPFMSYPMGVLADIISASSTFAVAGVVLIAFMTLMFLINPRYTFSRFEPRVADAGAAQRPAAASAPANGRAAAANGAGAPASEGEAAALRSRPARPREYMVGSSAAPASRDYMGNGDGGDGADGAASNGAATDGGTTDGLPRAAPAPSTDGRLRTASDSATGSSAATGNGRSGPAPSQAARTESDYGLKQVAAGRGNGAGPDVPPERVDVPTRRSAGPIERTTVAAITATLIAGVLSSLVFRRR